MIRSFRHSQYGYSLIIYALGGTGATEILLVRPPTSLTHPLGSRWCLDPHRSNLKVVTIPHSVLTGLDSPSPSSYHQPCKG